MWLSTETIKILKEDGCSFDEVQEISERLDKIDDWTEKFITEEKFWNNVYANINSQIIKKEKCII